MGARNCITLWQAVASGGTSIGLKGAELAAKTLAKSAIEIYSNPSIIDEAKAELNERVGNNFEYKPLLGDRKPPLEYRKVNRVELKQMHLAF